MNPCRRTSNRNWTAPIILSVLACFPCHVAAGDEPSESQSPNLKTFFTARQGQYFYGIYMLGAKVGWVSETTRLVASKDGDVIESATRGKIRLKLFGTENRMEFTATSQYSLEGDGPLIHAEESTLDGDSESSSTAIREPGGYHVVLKSEGQERQVHTGPSKDNLRTTYDVEQWLKAERKPGDTISEYSFDFERLATEAVGDERHDPDEQETLTFVKRREARWGGVPVTLTEAKVKMGLVSVGVEVLPDGTPVMMSFGPMKARLEEEEIAKNIELVVGDMLAFVPVKKDLGLAENVRKATIELSGIGDFQVPQTARQRVLESRPGFVLLGLESGRRPSSPSPLTKKESRQFTAATLRIQSDHDRIVTLAREIVGDETDRMKQVSQLQHWVFENIRGSYSDNAATALRVLEKKAGDCTENALLFVALARSLQIPAREVGGLIYSNDSKAGFYWHAWADIHDGARWIGVDPSFDEVGIDAAHIKMDEDAANYTSAVVMGKLKIRVRDFEVAE